MSDEHTELENGTEAAVAEGEAQVETAPEPQETAEPAPPSQAATEPVPSQVQTGANQPAQAQQPALDYEKSYRELRPAFTRATQELADLKRTWGDLDPKRAREAVAEIERRQQMANVSRFSRRHPEYQQTRSRLDRADMFARGAAGMEPDQARDLMQRMGVNAEDLKLYQEARAERERATEEFFSDPQAFIHERVEALVQQHMQNYDTWTNGRRDAEQWLNDNGTLLKNHAVDLNRMVDPNVPLQEKLAFMGQVFSERDALKAKLGQSVEQVSQAQAQQSLLRSRTQGAGRQSGRAPAGARSAQEYVEKVLKISRSSPNYITAMAEANQRLINGETLA